MPLDNFRWGGQFLASIPVGAIWVSALP